MEEKQDRKKYWLKLDKDFLKSPQIKVIKNMPNGKDYIIFYLSLMLESVETVGHLRFTSLVPYNDEMLSAITDTNVDIVRSATKIFCELGMMQIFDDGTIFMTEVPKITGKECESAERVRRYRLKQQEEKDKMLQCNANVTKSNAYIEEDKEKDKEIRNKKVDKEKDKEKENFTDTQKKKTNNITYFLKIISNNNYKYIKENNDVYNKITEWLNYKQERKELYKEIGLKNLLKQIDSKIDNYGEEAIINLISECMANNYKGIIFDKINKEQNEYKGMSFIEQRYIKNKKALWGDDYNG